MRAISAVVTKRHGSVVARRLPDLVQRCVWKPDEIVLSGENAQTNVLSRQQAGYVGSRRALSSATPGRVTPAAAVRSSPAEKAGRRCVAMEIEPRYCDVIVERWQNFIGKQAVLDGDGRTFDAIADERLAKAA